jgi:hypothetical protein
MAKTIYEAEGALFRGTFTGSGYMIDDIWSFGKSDWVSYQGERFKPPSWPVSVVQPADLNDMILALEPDEEA